MAMAFTVSWKAYLSVALLLAAFAVDGLLATATDEHPISLSVKKVASQDSPSQGSPISLPGTMVKTGEKALKKQSSSTLSPTSSSISARLLATQRYLIAILLAVFVFALLLCCTISIQGVIGNEHLFSQLYTTTYVVNRDETLLATVHKPYQPSQDGISNIITTPDYFNQWSKQKPLSEAQVQAPVGQLNLAATSGTKFNHSLDDAHYRLISGSNMSPTKYSISCTESEQRSTGENETDLSSRPTPPTLLLLSPKPKRKQHSQMVATATVKIQVDQEEDDQAPLVQSPKAK